MAAPYLRRGLRGSTRATCAMLAVLGAAGLAALAGPDLMLLAALAFASFYVGHGAAWPLLSTVPNGRVTAAHRATAVSAMSLAMALGGILGNLVLPSVVRVAGVDGAFLAVAVLTLLGGALCLRLPADSSVVCNDHELPVSRRSGDPRRQRRAGTTRSGAAATSSPPDRHCTSYSPSVSRTAVEPSPSSTTAGGGSPPCGSAATSAS